MYEKCPKSKAQFPFYKWSISFLTKYNILDLKLFVVKFNQLPEKMLIYIKNQRIFVNVFR